MARAVLEKTPVSRFFFLYAVLLLAIVVLGFAPSFFSRIAVQQTPLALHLHIHGALLSGWFALLVMQAALIRRANPSLHRRLGRFIAAYGLLVVVIGGLLATLNVVPRQLAAGVTFETDMADVNPLQGSGVSFLEFISGIVWFNMGSVLAFVVLLTLAVVFRSRADFHKRFVLLASVAIIPPALARIARVVEGNEQGLFIPASMLGLLLVILVYDILTRHRVHKATWIGSGVVIATTALSGAMAVSPAGLDLVRSLG